MLCGAALPSSAEVTRLEEREIHTTVSYILYIKLCAKMCIKVSYADTIIIIKI